MASFVPPTFSDYGKTLRDLLTKGYQDKVEGTVKTVNSQGLTVESNAVATGDRELDGGIKFNYKNASYGEVEVNCRTSGDCSLKAKTGKLLNGLDLTVNTDTKPVSSVEAVYKRANVSVVDKVTFTSKENVGVASLSVGYDGLSLGGAVQYNLSKGAVEDYNVGAEYSHKDFTCTLATSNRIENIQAAYVHRYNRDLTLGALFEFDLQNSVRPSKLTVGSELAVDVNTTVKAKVNTLGQLNAGVEYRLTNPSLKVNVGFQAPFSGPDCCKPQKFGLGVTFGDY